MSTPISQLALPALSPLEIVSLFITSMTLFMLCKWIYLHLIISCAVFLWLSSLSMTISRSQIGKGVRQGCILSPCLFNLYAEYIMRDTELEEAQTGIKITGRNINNLRYADDTTLVAESEEELKSLLMKVKERGKPGLTLNIQKTKIMAFSPITSWQIDGETVADFLFLGSKSLQMVIAAMKLKDSYSLEGKLWPTLTAY